MSKLQLASIALSKGGKSALKHVLGKTEIKSVTQGGIESETINALTRCNVNGLRKRVKGEVVFAEGVDADSIKDAREALKNVGADFNANVSDKVKKATILGIVQDAIDDGNINLDIAGSGDSPSGHAFTLKLKKAKGLTMKERLLALESENAKLRKMLK